MTTFTDRIERQFPGIPDASYPTTMPRYRCHKVVCAVKIHAIIEEVMPVFKGAICRGCVAFNSACGRCEKCTWERQHGSAMSVAIVPEGDETGPIITTLDYFQRHKPEVGGYFVVYEDGYQSYSPAKAFEDGYTRI